MRSKLIESLDEKQTQDVPNFRVGDNIKVNVRIKEGNKERIQTFEGLVITKKGEGTGSSVVVRKISYGIGVERTFLVHSPLISGIEVLRSNKVRKARLFYMRERKGKSARLKEIKR